jgi:hypothetical protein
MPTSETNNEYIAGLKQRFHVVQLALFNANLLASIQEHAEASPQGELARLVDECAKQTISAFPPAPSTINQSLFFGMAYLTLVWLRDSMSQEDLEKSLASDRMTNVWKGATADGPRDVSDPAQKMRLIRNALSHAHVMVDEDFTFNFWDQNKRGRNPEVQPTHLRINSLDLGRILHQFYFAVSDVIYK